MIRVDILTPRPLPTVPIHPMNRLTSAERKQLRGIAQRLKPAIHVGKQGVTPTIMGEIEMALEKQELIKIRFDASRDTLKTWADQICIQSNAELVGTIGHTATIYREHEQPGAGS